MPDTTERFDDLVSRVAAAVAASDPFLAAQRGLVPADHGLPDLSPESNDTTGATWDAALGELEAIPEGNLDLERRIDKGVLRGFLRRERWTTRYRPGFRDPLRWNSVVAQALRPFPRGTQPSEAEAPGARARLRALPDFLEAGRRALGSTSRLHIDLARSQLPAFLEAARALTIPGGAAVERALCRWGAHLDDQAEAAAPDGWRLGPDRYREYLELVLETGRAADDHLADAEREVADAIGALGALAGCDSADHDALAEFFESLGDDSPSPGGLVEAAREALDEVREFCASRRLVPDLPADVLVVEAAPDHVRGMATAYLDILDSSDQEAFRYAFVISPPRRDMSEAEARQYLRRFPRGLLRIYAAHEGYPGHFVQHSLGRRNPSVVRRFVVSGTHLEGWACYVERMVMAEGFRADCTATQAAAWKGRLAIALNLILDHQLHTGEGDPSELRDRLIRQGGALPGEADQKMTRAKATCAQLSTYFAGAEAMSALATDWRQAHPGGSLRELHRAMLVHGRLAPVHLRDRLGLPAQVAQP